MKAYYQHLKNTYFRLELFFCIFLCEMFGNKKLVPFSQFFGLVLFYHIQSNSDLNLENFAHCILIGTYGRESQLLTNSANTKNSHRTSCSLHRDTYCTQSNIQSTGRSAFAVFITLNVNLNRSSLFQCVMHKVLRVACCFTSKQIYSVLCVFSTLWNTE